MEIAINEDINFLENLQKELLTQENDGQAAPRYWSIMDYRTVPANDDYDSGAYQHFYNDGDHTEFESFSDLKEFIEEHSEEEIEKDCDLYEYLNDINEDFCALWEYIEDNLNDDGYFSKVFSKEESYLVPDRLFLIKSEAKKHIESNPRHYSPKAHTYAMTAWRAPKMERLMKILETFEWDKLLNGEVK